MAGPGAATADPAAQGQGELQQIVKLGTEVDRALISLAQVATAGQAEFAQARQLIAAGLQKFAAEQGQAPTGASPTAPGNSFPGGGFSSQA